MTISQIIEEGKRQTGVSDDAQMAFLLNTALAELYVYGSHLLQEVTLDIPYPSNGSAFTVFTMPWYVKHIRAVRRSGDIQNVELNTPAPGYFDNTWEEAGNNWVEIGTTPLDAPLTNPSKLVFKKHGPDTTDVAVAVTGPTTYAETGSEEFTLDDEYTTDNAYADVVSIVKSVVNNVNIKVYDEFGTQISLLPNYLTESPRIKIRTVIMGETDVLYEPYLAAIPHASIAYPVDLAVIWKLKELAKGEALFEADPSVFTTKAQMLNHGATDRRNHGKTLRPMHTQPYPSLQGSV